MNDAWFYKVGEAQTGPVPLVELRRLVQIGQLGPNVLVWAQGSPGWIPASQALGMPLPPEDGIQYLVPTGRTSGISLVAGYLGLFGLVICPLAPFALICGILGLRDLKSHPEKNGKGRAITGIVCGGFVTVATLVWFLVVALHPRHY